MTKETGYVRKPSTQIGLIKLRYLKYPKVAELMAERHINYNEQVAYIERQQENGQAFVIRPQFPGNVGRVEKDAEKLRALYRQGYEDAEACYGDMMEYLKDCQ